MADYSYKGFVRWQISNGKGAIGIPVVAFKDPGTNFAMHLARLLNDQDISGALYSAVSYGGIYLLLPRLQGKDETEHKGRFHDLSYLQQYGKGNKASMSMSFSVEKHQKGKLLWMYSLRDPAATVRSVDLVNQSYVWYTELILELPSPILLSDGIRIAGKQ